MISRFKYLFRNPINKNIGANFFGVLITLLNQILMIPIFLNNWGIDKYGDWIVLTSLSGFLTMTDVGLNSVTANQFAIRYTEGKKNECNSLIANNYFFLSILSIIFISASLLYLVFGNINRDFDIRVTSLKVTRIVFFLLEIKIFIFMFSTIPNAIYRAVSLFSRAMFLDNLVRLAETIFLFTGVTLKLDIQLIVFLMLTPGIFILIFKYFDTNKYIKYSFSTTSINLRLLRSTVLPSFGFLAFPVSNAIVQQGITLVVNSFMGASAMVLFNTTRTLVGFIKQLTNIIAMAVWPELSIAYGKKDYKKMQNIHHNSVAISTALTVFASIFVMCFGKFIYEVWTTNKLAFNGYLMMSFLLMLLANNGWYTSSMSLMATNQHTKLGIYYLVLATTSIGMVYILMLIYPKIELVPVCLLIIDTLLSIWVVKRVLILTKDNFNNMLSGIYTQLNFIKKL